MRLACGLAMLTCACEPSSPRPAPQMEPDAAPIAPDGVPVTLDPSMSVAASLPADADGDGDRDLYVVLRSLAPPFRLALLRREGDRYAPPLPISAGVLDELSEGAVDAGSLSLEDGPGDFVTLSYRFEDSCALAEHEEVEVRLLLHPNGPDASPEPAFSYFSRYRRLPCRRGDREYLDACRPEPFADRTASLEPDSDGALQLRVSARSLGEPFTLTFMREQGAWQQSATQTVEVVEHLWRAAEEAVSDQRRGGAPALAAVEQALEVFDLACPATGIEMSCHGSSLGIPQSLRTTCEHAGRRSALLLMAARALAHQGRARAALIRLGQAKEASADLQALDRSEREILALAAPRAARVVGIMSDAVAPEGDLVAQAPSLVWESNESLLYPRASDELGRYIVGEGDQGRVRGLEAVELRRGRPTELRSPSGALAVVFADDYGVFVCPTGADERRACMETARIYRRRGAELSCTLVDERLGGPPVTRLTLGRCAGAPEPQALGFVDDDHLAVVGAEATEAVMVSVRDPGQRAPLPASSQELVRRGSFAPDGSFRLVKTDLGLFRIERGGPLREERLLPPGFDPEGIVIAPDGKHFAAFVSTSGARVFEMP